MEAYLNQLIFSCPEDRRYWVVRAAGGSYVRNFHSGSVAAIGHLDHLNFDESTDPLKFDYVNLRGRLGEDENRSSSSITSHLNQIETFVAEIERGDFIVTLDASELSIGQVTSDAYISKTSILYGVAPNILEMDYQLRRNVNWGPILKRGELPSGMNNSLHAHQTVFNIDSYWAAVHHLVFPFFRRGDNFYFTLHIRQNEEISNYSLGQLFVLLSEFEAISKAKNTSSLDADFESYFQNFRAKNKLSLSTKAEFMSPGDIWGAVQLDIPSMLAFMLAYGMLFGGDVLGIKLDGLIDKEMRHKIFDMLAKRIGHHDGAAIRQDLKLRKPNKDTSALTDEQPRQGKRKRKN